MTNRGSCLSQDTHSKRVSLPQLHVPSSCSFAFVRTWSKASHHRADHASVKWVFRVRGVHARSCLPTVRKIILGTVVFPLTVQASAIGRCINRVRRCPGQGNEGKLGRGMVYGLRDGLAGRPRPTCLGCFSAPLFSWGQPSLVDDERHDASCD